MEEGEINEGKINEVPKDKKLFEYEGHGHEAGRYVHSGIMDQFFDKHLKG